MKFDSKLEERYYNTVLLPKVKSGEIRDLKRLDRYKDFNILCDSFYVIKDGKKTKIREIKYTPDFTFRDSNNKLVYLELKSSWTKNKTEYNIRKKIFISKLFKNEIFIECLEVKKNQYKYEVYRPL